MSNEKGPKMEGVFKLRFCEICMNLTFAVCPDLQYIKSVNGKGFCWIKHVNEEKRHKSYKDKEHDGNSLQSIRA